MKGFSYRRSVFAVAVAACSTTGYAQSQSQCDQQIRQVEQEVQQRQVDQQLRSEIEDLLVAAGQNPADCNVYVSEAQQLLQERGQTAASQSAQQTQGQQQASTSPQGVERASEVIGKSVKDTQGEDLGSIEDFALNMEDGKLAYVVLSTGGTFSSKNVGVPVDMLRKAPQGEGYEAQVSKQEIESAQSLPDSSWPAQPTLGGGQSSGGGTAEPASELIGREVQDSQGQQLGTIEDFAVDVEQGQLAYVVLSTGGGTFGMGDEKLVGLPATALQQAEDAYVASVSQQEIENAQELPENNWPQQPTIASAGQPAGAGGVEQSSRIEGQTVTNRQGETLGQIEEFALDMKQGKLAYVAIMTSEGKRIGVPADMLQEAPQGEGYVADISRQQLQSAEELPRQNWPEQPSLATSGSQTGSASQGSGQLASFSALDQNQDGYISQQEAQQAGQEVSRSFEEIDQNADQQIDRSEFAAFEQQKQ